jgi:hypothetical protein
MNLTSCRTILQLVNSSSYLWGTQEKSGIPPVVVIPLQCTTLKHYVHCALDVADDILDSHYLLALRHNLKTNNVSCCFKIPSSVYVCAYVLYVNRNIR